MSAREKVQTQSSSCCGPSQDVAETNSGDGQKPVYAGWVTAETKYGMYIPALDGDYETSDSPYPLPGPIGVTQVFQEAGVEKGSKVLEVAASIGHVAMLAAKITGPEGEAVFGQLDQTLDEASKAYHAKYGLQDAVRVVKASAENIPYPENYFDAVISDRAVCCLYSKVESQQQFINEIAKVTKPDGRVVLVEAVPLNAPPEGKRVPGCISNTTFTREPETVVAMLKQAGLERISIQRIPNSKMATKEMADAAGVPSEDGYLEFAIISGTKKRPDKEQTLQTVAQSGAGCCNPLDEE